MNQIRKSRKKLFLPLSERNKWMLKITKGIKRNRFKEIITIQYP